MSTEISPTLTYTDSEINESIVPPVLLFVLGVTGNIAALVILIRSSAKHKWMPFYRFVGGLIATDLSGIVLTYPFVISAYVSNFTIVFPSALCGFISFIITFAFMTNALIICAMSLDRFLALMCPMTYRKLSNGFRITLTLLGIWILTAIVCSLPLIGLGSFKSFYPGSWCFFNFTSDGAKDKAFTYLYSVIALLIIVSTITLNAMVILSLCWKFYSGESQNTKHKRNDVSTIVYIVAVVTLFVVCTTPLMIRMLIHASTDDPDDEETDLMTARLAVANVVIDPWVYLLFKNITFTSIRRQSRSLLRRISMRRIEGGGESAEVANTQDLSYRTEDTYV